MLCSYVPGIDVATRSGTLIARCGSARRVPRVEFLPHFGKTSTGGFATLPSLLASRFSLALALALVASDRRRWRVGEPAMGVRCVAVFVLI